MTNLLRLLSLADAVKQKVERGELEMGHARALLSLPEASQLEVAQMISDKELSVRETEEIVRNLLTPALPKMPKSIDPDVKRLQQDLSAV